MSIDAMFAVPPAELVQARELSHTSVQWASRAARANLEARADDSHSNLGWHEGVQGLVSHPLDDGQRCQLGFSFSTGSLVWLVDGNSTALLALEQADEAAARTWCDEQLSAAGLATTDHAEMPYELDPVDYRGFADAGAKEALATLGAWYAKSQSVLDGLVREFGTMAVATPTVRCWPHHFDLGTLFVLDEDDPETARSVGVGFSPGDGSYAEALLLLHTLANARGAAGGTGATALAHRRLYVAGASRQPYQHGNQSRSDPCERGQGSAG